MPSPDPNSYPHLPLQLLSLCPFLAKGPSDKAEQEEELEMVMELLHLRLNMKVPLQLKHNRKPNLEVGMIIKVWTGF